MIDEVGLMCRSSSPIWRFQLLRIGVDPGWRCHIYPGICVLMPLRREQAPSKGPAFRWWCLVYQVAISGDVNASSRLSIYSQTSSFFCVELSHLFVLDPVRRLRFDRYLPFICYQAWGNCCVAQRSRFLCACPFESAFCIALTSTHYYGFQGRLIAIIVEYIWEHFCLPEEARGSVCHCCFALRTRAAGTGLCGDI